MESVKVLKRFARWVSIGGKCHHKKFGQTFALVAVARKHGMQLIVGFKPGMHFWHEIGLAGTPAAMKKTEAEWKRQGHEIKTKKPPGAFGFNLDREESKWYEFEMVKRIDHGCYGSACAKCDVVEPTQRRN